MLCNIFVYSQGWYVRPSIEYKINTSNNYLPDLVTNEGYIIQVRPLNVTAQKAPFLGLYVGYRKKNCFFETGLVQDYFATGIIFQGYDYNIQTNEYEQKRIRYYGGFKINRVPLHLGIRLWGSDTLKTGRKYSTVFFLNGGIDVFFYTPHKYDYYTNQFITDSLGNTLSLSVYNDSGEQTGRFWKKNIGFSLKVNTAKRNIYFSLNYSFWTGLKGYINPPGSTYTNITFIDQKGTTYSNFLAANGSGLYFSVSTNIGLKKRKSHLSKTPNF